MKLDYRIGHGFDVHAFVEGRALILGGVEVPYRYGLLGHSDADVVIHALCDALLGAVALRDIGFHFPDSDSQYKGADSMLFLSKIVADLQQKGWGIGNADITIIAQAPKLSDYIPAMGERLASAMNITLDEMNIKATTTEKLGFTGRKEGIAAQAVVLLGRLDGAALSYEKIHAR